MAQCKICRESEAVLPEGEGRERYCESCWNNRLKQLWQAEDKFRTQRVIRTTEAEKYFVFHEAVKQDDGLAAIVFCLHDVLADHLDVTAYLLDVLPWDEKVPIIYKEGVDSEAEQLDVFLSYLEGDIIGSWRAASWTMEVTRCTGQSFWIDSRERDVDKAESDDDAADDDDDDRRDPPEGRRGGGGRRGGA
ncbi:MAG TPA: hypothetical protein VEI02_09625 [Planctomycetota bacterium]|nr:hypothetical protein [Planctomycetota bacterium]